MYILQILTTVFQCMPIQGLWDYSVKAHCGVNINDFFIGNAVPNIITDWAMLILPLPYVWKIQRSTTQKVALCGAFAMGGLYVSSLLSLRVTFSVLISAAFASSQSFG